MKRNLAWTLTALVVVVGASLKFTPSASSSSFNQGGAVAPEVTGTANLLPFLATSFDVDRTDDTAAATGCTAAPGDCSLRGAIIAANADLTAMPVIINLQPGTTYNLTLTNTTQENAAATGDLDITTNLHTVTIVGGESSGPLATIIDAAGLNIGSLRDRAFQVTGSGVTAIFQDLVIRNGKAADDGTTGVSTNPAAQNTNRLGGGILNNGGSVTLDNVILQSCQAQGRGDSNANPAGILEARGGGLVSLGVTGNVVIMDSTLSGNIAQGGDGPGGNNNVGSGAKGGSIYIEGGSLNITRSLLDSSAANGGNGTGVPQDGMLNGGFGGLAQGGGVWIGGGTAVSIDNTTFENTVANGGNSGAGGNGSEPAGGADGGGLYSLGNITVSNSTFHLAGATGGNAGDAFGPTCIGGHNAGDGGGARGGAIFADGGTMIINTATFANNFAIGGNGGDGGQTNGGLNCGMHGAGGLAYGGAITNNNGATVNIKHGTISLNNAQAGDTGVNQGGANKPPRLVAEGTGGGIRVGSGSVTLENTIIAGNTAANGAGDTTGAPTPGPNVDGAVTSNGHNLLGTAAEATGFSGIGDQTGAIPLLAALADNGGPTQTMALLIGSPAIDAGVAAGSLFDQRGLLRTFNDLSVVNALTSDGTDIGAFELQPICSLTCPTDITVPNDAGLCSAVVNYTTPSGAGCGTVTCDHPSGSVFPVGNTIVTCTSSAGPTCNFKVTVKDVEPPVITTTATPIELWPPNHRYETFGVTDLVVSARDLCDTSVNVDDVVITSATSDEPENGNGDGDTSDDIIVFGNDCQSVRLRSERMGGGNGRVYTITFKVADAAGNVASATKKITVPHSQNGSPAVDDGPAFTVLSECPFQTNLLVRSHYLDFLNREPDTSGFNFWTDVLKHCTPKPGCQEGKQIDVSAAFFLSTEFQKTGYLVERFYKVAYGDATGNSTFGGAHQLPVPAVRLVEFLKDAKRIGQGLVVLQPGWEQVLANNQQAYALEFVQTSRFITSFPTTMTPTQFVDRLNHNAGDVLSSAERTTAINLFGAAGDTSNTRVRAQVVRQVAEDQDLYDAEFNRAFVLAQYFGYLRRNPNDAPESTLDYTGYDFWLRKLNQFNGNYGNADMVKAFLSSGEYRRRVGL